MSGSARYAGSALVRSVANSRYLDSNCQQNVLRRIRTVGTTSRLFEERECPPLSNAVDDPLRRDDVKRGLLDVRVCAEVYKASVK